MKFESKESLNVGLALLLAVAAVLDALAIADLNRWGGYAHEKKAIVEVGPLIYDDSLNVASSADAK